MNKYEKANEVREQIIKSKRELQELRSNETHQFDTMFLDNAILNLNKVLDNFYNYLR